MKKFHSARKIPAFFQAVLLSGCLVLSACGDASSTSAVKTTPPFQAIAQVTPFSPVIFEQVTTAAATTLSITTASPTTKQVTTAALPTILVTTSAPSTTLVTTAAPTTTPPRNIRNDWLRGLPCKAPCWENITPGKTTPEEAQALLEKNSAIGKIQVENPQFGTKPAAIYLSQRNGSKPWGLISYHNEPKPAKIEIIKLEVEFYQPKEAFALYGEPSHVIVREKTNELGRGTGDYKTYLVYLNQGMILSSLPSTETALTPETDFNEVYFFIPGQAGFDILDAQDDVTGKFLVKWEGFKDAIYYCRYQNNNVIKTC